MNKCVLPEKDSRIQKCKAPNTRTKMSNNYNNNKLYNKLISRVKEK